MELRIETPADAATAIARLSEAPRGTVAVLAGGTDLLLDLESGRVRATRLLSLRRLPWRGLDRADGRVRIGSLKPLREIERSPGIREDLPGLFEAIRSVGSVALRHRATLGGNIVRSAPASDLLPILLALDAELEILGPQGARRTALAEFLATPRAPTLGPAELVEAVLLPERAPSAFLWQRVRPTNDISQVGVAVAQPTGEGPWRIALGGVAPVAAQLPEAEALVQEPRLTRAAIDGAADAARRWATFETDRRATEEYRRQIVGVLTRRALERAGSRASERGGPR